MIKNEIENIISVVVPGSIADKMGVLPGDRLVAINDQTIEDVIDYRFLTSDEHLEVMLIKTDGSEWVLEIEKDFDEELGIEFENPVMASTRQCHNKCIFCFIDQMPAGMRPGLYVKDDDSRLSFLQGNYITLTNMKSEEIDKLIRYHISPLNISVHTTNPVLREKMLNNRFAGDIMNSLKNFHQNNMKMNLQIVLCPGYNDGQELERTLKDVEQLAGSLISIAVVPVGLTKYQKNSDLLPVDKNKAEEVIKQIEKWQNRWMKLIGRRLVYPADEFYLKAGRPWPKAETYEAFYQMENGVGMLASFEKDFEKYNQRLPLIRKKKPFTLTIATGRAAASFMEQLSRKVMRKIEGLTIKIMPIENNFFGERIDVSGLITGRDLINQLSGKELGGLLMIPDNMLKNQEDVFLDDVRLDDIRESLGVPVKPCSIDGKQWIKDILRFTNEKSESRSEIQHDKTHRCCHRSAKCR